MVGALLAVLVYAAGYFEGGKEGPCWFTDVMSEHPEAATFRIERSAFPPRQRCVALSSDGEEIASHTYPEPAYYGVALAMFLAPFAFTALWRARRRRQ